MAVVLAVLEELGKRSTGLLGLVRAGHRLSLEDHVLARRRFAAQVDCSWNLLERLPTGRSELPVQVHEKVVMPLLGFLATGESLFGVRCGVRLSRRGWPMA